MCLRQMGNQHDEKSKTKANKSVGAVGRRGGLLEMTAEEAET